MSEETINTNNADIVGNDAPDIENVVPFVPVKQKMLLTTAVLSRFTDAHEIKLPDVSPNAVFRLRPMTRSKMKDITKRLKVCMECGGRGLTVDKIGMLHTCPVCRGSKDVRGWADLEVRVAYGKWIIASWDGLEAEDPATGEHVEVPYDEITRDAIADTPAFDVIFEAAWKLANRVNEQTEGN